MEEAWSGALQVYGSASSAPLPPFLFSTRTLALPQMSLSSFLPLRTSTEVWDPDTLLSHDRSLFAGNKGLGASSPPFLLLSWLLAFFFLQSPLVDDPSLEGICVCVHTCEQSLRFLVFSTLSLMCMPLQVSL